MPATFLPQTGQYLDPIGAALGQGFGQGMQESIMRRKLGEDQQAMLNWLSGPTMGANQIMSPALGNFGMGGGGMAPMPSFQTPQFQQLGMQLMGQQAMNRLPSSALDQARIAGIGAEAQRDLAYAENLRNPPMQPPSPSDLKAQEMQRLDNALSRMEAGGKTETPAYKALKRRRDEMYGYDVSGESPQQQIAQMKLDALGKLDNNSFEFKRALGITIDKPVPEKLHTELTDALTAINKGADPIKVYREFFRANPEFQEYSSGVRRILLAGEDPFAAFLESLTK